MKKVLFLLFCLLLLLLSINGLAEDTFELLISDNENLYAVDLMKNVYKYEDNSFKSVITLDETSETAFIHNNNLCILKNERNEIKILNSNRELIDSFNFDSFDLDNYYISNVQSKSDKICFVLRSYFENSNVASIIQVDLKSKNIKQIPRIELINYSLNVDGSIYVAKKNAENIGVYLGFFENDLKHMYNINSEYSFLAWDENKLWAINTVDKTVALFENGKIIRAGNNNASQYVNKVQIYKHQYISIINSELVVLDINDVQDNVKTLVVEFSPSQEADLEFMALHPDVQIKTLESLDTGDQDFLQHIITHGITVDVFKLSNNTPGLKQFIKKGYLADLSVKPEIVEKVNSMYKPISDFAHLEDKIVMLPIWVAINSDFYIQSSFDLANLDILDIPNNYIDFLKWVIDLYDNYNIDSASVSVKDLGRRPYQSLLLSAIDKYVESYIKRNETLTFRTQTFRELLDLVRQVAQRTEIPDENYNPNFLFYGETTKLPKLNFVNFPLIENEVPKYTGQIETLAVNALSPVKDIAIEYINFVSDYMTDKTTSISLYNGNYEAIESKIYIDGKRELQELELAFNKAKNEQEKTAIQKQINEVKSRVNDYTDYLRYDASEEQIDFYQNEIIPNVWFPYTNTITSLSHRNSWFHNMLKEYINNNWTDDSFIEQLEQRVNMMQLEGEE